MGSDTKPRRRPKRASSEQIVASILDAAELLLVEQGFDKLTTNRIAERAGVSVGSVYQYFPNKQAIVAGISRRINEAIVDEMKQVVAAQLPLRERVAAALEVICSDRVGDAAVRRELLLHVPRSWEHTGVASGEQAVSSLLAASVKELMPLCSEQEIEDRNYVMLFAARGAAQAALLYRPELLRDGRLTTILVDMFTGPDGAQAP